MKRYLRRIDTDTIGNRNDVTPLFAGRDALRQLIDDLAAPFRQANVNAVVAIDVSRPILGTAVAERLDAEVAGIATICMGQSEKTAGLPKMYLIHTVWGRLVERGVEPAEHHLSGGRTEGQDPIRSGANGFIGCRSA